MTTDHDTSKPLKTLMKDPALAEVLDSDRFKQFLDHIPFAIAVAALQPAERVTYVNLGFEKLTGQPAAELLGHAWSDMNAIASAEGSERQLSEAITADEDHIGTFRIALKEGGDGTIVDAWSNVIQDDKGTAMFRLVALAPAQPARQTDVEDLLKRFQQKDVLLRELQHRVKNNLQLITSLIRLESRNAAFDEAEAPLDRLAGRVSALALLYGTLSAENTGDTIDLGTYLSQIASSVMNAHAVEGIRLDLMVDSWPVSINVAMPTGLVVNEVLTNALKHAFVGREGGTITLHSTVDAEGCQILIADDGVGLPVDITWPTSGRLGSLIVQSLRQNAGATLAVNSAPNEGLRVVIRFARAAAGTKG